MLCSKFTQLEMLVKVDPCIVARLKDTEKRHNTHMVRTIFVCLYRTRMVRKIVPYAYGVYQGITLFTLFHNPTELRKITVNQKSGKKKCCIEEGSNPGSQCARADPEFRKRGGAPF